MAAPTIANKPKRVHPVDEVLPVPKLATYGFQHVVAFYAGAVLVPIIIAGSLTNPGYSSTVRVRPSFTTWPSE